MAFVSSLGRERVFLYSVPSRRPAAFCSPPAETLGHLISSLAALVNEAYYSRIKSFGKMHRQAMFLLHTVCIMDICRGHAFLNLSQVTKSRTQEIQSCASWRYSNLIRIFSYFFFFWIRSFSCSAHSRQIRGRQLGTGGCAHGIEREVSRLRL